MASQYPPDLSSQQADYVLSVIKDWSIAHGFAVRVPTSLVSSETDPGQILALPAPVTLFPSLFPRPCFEEGLEIQRAYNELYAAIVRDEGWLGSIIEELLDVDEFVAKLWEVHLTVKAEGYVQDLCLGIFRSDYMVHSDPSTGEAEPELKQIEFNTIASSFGGLSERASQLHEHLVKTSAYPESPYLKTDNLPSNTTISELARGLAVAHAYYGMGAASMSSPLPRCIVMVIQEAERNIFDQKHLEYRLQEYHQIPIFRVPFPRMLDYTRIAKGTDRQLIYHAPHLPQRAYEVTVVYFRAGYSPDEYSSPTAWAARLHLERSAAIKCPSILTHLAGSKKVQQVLATPPFSQQHLARFLSDPHDPDRVRKTFTNIYPLDDTPAGLAARKLALDPSSAASYVLKPQREGGGNNIYRSAIPAFLRSVPESHWKSYILMELIQPPPTTRNTIFRNGAVQSGDVIGELGVYGVALWRQPRTSDDYSSSSSRSPLPLPPLTLENWVAGHLLRTKGSDSEEGGVAAGFGCVDSCLLT